MTRAYDTSTTTDHSIEMVGERNGAIRPRRDAHCSVESVIG